MININQFVELVIRPTLQTMAQHKCSINSPAAENLLMGTALMESNLQHLQQIPNGPAVGLYQMEPATHDGLWVNYLLRKPGLAVTLREIAGYRYFNWDNPPASHLAGNLYYATAMARVHYWRFPVPLPAADDIEGLAWYWKKFYNTADGKGDAMKFVNVCEGVLT